MEETAPPAALAQPRVRAILLDHAMGRLGEPVAAAVAGAPSTVVPGPAALDGWSTPVAADPTRLVPAQQLAAVLQRLAARGGPDAVRAAGRDYIALWARTFRTLAGHLRARPERALSLFADELYPFLRGERLASRLERRPTDTASQARVVLVPGLPEEYCCGLLEGMLEVSGCTGTVDAVGGGAFDVRIQIPAAQRLARVMQAAATLRLPLLAAALLAGLVGAAAALTQAPRTGLRDLGAWVNLTNPWLRAPIAALAVLAVQGAANAWHDLRSPAPGGPIAPWRPARVWLWGQVAVGYSFAAGAGTLLAPASPWILAFVPLGLAASLLYHRVRDHGMGILLVALTHGPLIAFGVLVAARPDATTATVVLTLLASLPVGALAAAVRTLDDLADRPLDEAGGRRTLAVRLPAVRMAWVYAALLAASVGVLAALAAALARMHGELLSWTLVAALAACGMVLARRVRANLDDPGALAAARAGTIAVHVAVAALAVTFASGAV